MSCDRYGISNTNDGVHVAKLIYYGGKDVAVGEVNQSGNTVLRIVN